MTTNLLFNSSNYDSTTGKLTYNFPLPTMLSKKEVSLNSASIYNCFFNVSSSIGNNKITLNWPVFSGSNAYTMTPGEIVIPNGFYSVEQLNQVIQLYCVTNGYYCVNTVTQNYVFFVQLSANSTAYAFQLDVWGLPTSTQAAALSFTTGGMVLNIGTQSVSPTIVIPASLKSLLGLTPATYPAAPSVVVAGSWSASPVSSTLSSQTPQINPVTSLVVKCNLVNNNYCIPTNLLAMIPITSQYGGVTQTNIYSPLWSDVMNQTFSSIELTFADQNGNTLIPIDSEITAVLCIRTKA